LTAHSKVRTVTVLYIPLHFVMLHVSTHHIRGAVMMAVQHHCSCHTEKVHTGRNKTL